MKKPQAQSSLTSHFFVCKVFWDRGGGHSQPMVLLGILKETRERSGGMERWKTSQISDPGCASVDLLKMVVTSQFCEWMQTEQIHSF